MDRKRRIFTGSVLFVGLLCAGGMDAAELWDNCIKVAGYRKAWRLDPGSDWTDVLVNTLTLESDSDLIVSALALFSDVNVPGTQVLYRIQVDGEGASPHFRRRVPDDGPAAQNFSAIWSDLAQGTKTIRFQAKYAGGSAPVYYPLVWFTPLSVDGNEATFEAHSGATITPLSGSAWTTVQSLNVTHGLDAMLAIGASLRIVAGTPGASLEYRFVDGTTQVVAYADSSPAQMPDGVQLNRFYKPDNGPQFGSTTSNRTIALQVRSPAGYATSVQSAHLFVQTMPPYHVYEADGTGLPGIPYDHEYHVVQTTPWDFIDPISLGSQASSPDQYRSWVGGYAFMTLSPQEPIPTNWRLDIEREAFPPFSFDLGGGLGTPTDQVRLAPNLAGGCGDCGWFSSSRYRIILSARSECDLPGQSSDTVSRAMTQIVLMPSTVHESLNCPNWMPWRDCCNQSPGCTWSCETGSLPLASGIPFLTCPPPVEPPSCSGTMVQEAEDGSLVGFSTVSDGAASSGLAIEVPNGTGNQTGGPNDSYKASYCLTVPAAGTYRIEGRLKAPTFSDDSFWIRVDGVPAAGYLWDTAVSATYVDDFVNDVGGADPVEVFLDAGDHIVDVFLREDGTRLDRIELTPPSCGPLTQEAEDGTLVGFSTVVDGAASGGLAIEVPNGTHNQIGGPSDSYKASYCVTVSTAGTYRIGGRVHSSSFGDDSFWVKVDGVPTAGFNWVTPVGATYVDDYVNDYGNADPVEVFLGAGNHMVEVFLREDGTRLDRIELELQ